jgi:hypothetical protein
MFPIVIEVLKSVSGSFCQLDHCVSGKIRCGVFCFSIFSKVSMLALFKVNWTEYVRVGRDRRQQDDTEHILTIGHLIRDICMIEAKCQEMNVYEICHEINSSFNLDFNPCNELY